MDDRDHRSPRDFRTTESPGFDSFADATPWWPSVASGPIRKERLPTTGDVRDQFDLPDPWIGFHVSDITCFKCATKVHAKISRQRDYPSQFPNFEKFEYFGNRQNGTGNPRTGYSQQQQLNY